MQLEIISPEFTSYKGEVESIVVPGIKGEFEVLNNHTPIVSALSQGKIKIKGNLTIDKSMKDKFTLEGKVTFLDINSGTIEVKNNEVTVIVE